MDSVKLHQSTTLSIQSEYKSYPWTCLTLHFDWWNHFKNIPLLVHPIKCMQTGHHFKCSYKIHRIFLVIHQSILWGWVLDIDRITIVMKLTNERYSLCYCVLNYDENCTFDMYVYYMSFILYFFKTLEAVICCHFFHILLSIQIITESSIPIWIYSIIGNFTITTTSMHKT